MPFFLSSLNFSRYLFHTSFVFVQFTLQQGPNWAMSCYSVDLIVVVVAVFVDTQRFFSYYPIYKITHTQVSARARHNVYNKPNYKIIADFSITYTAVDVYLVCGVVAFDLNKSARWIQMNGMNKKKE